MEKWKTPVSFCVILHVAVSAYVGRENHYETKQEDGNLGNIQLQAFHASSLCSAPLMMLYMSQNLRLETMSCVYCPFTGKNRAIFHYLSQLRLSTSQITAKTRKKVCHILGSLLADLGGDILLKQLHTQYWKFRCRPKGLFS